MDDLHYIEVSKTDGTRYGIQAISRDGEGFAPHVSILDANGEPIKTIVDSEDTDEISGDPRDCIIRAMIYVV